MIPSSSSSSSSSSSLGTRKKWMKPSTKARPEAKWRTAAQQRVYGRRLLEALRATSGGEPRAVKEAADSALALTARGQSRWSRAILLGRCHPRRKLILRKAGGGKIRSGRRRTKTAAPMSVAAAAVLGGKRVGDRLRVLRRLVPGCRKLSVPILLQEAADYVAALEMQVKAMRALADVLSAESAAAGEAQRGEV